MGYIFLNKNYQPIDIATAFPEDIAYAFFDDDEDIKNFYAGEEYWHRGYMFAFDRPFKKAGAYSYNFKTDKWTNLWDEVGRLKGTIARIGQAYVDTRDLVLSGKDDILD